MIDTGPGIDQRLRDGGLRGADHTLLDDGNACTCAATPCRARKHLPPPTTHTGCLAANTNDVPTFRVLTLSPSPAVPEPNSSDGTLCKNLANLGYRQMSNNIGREVKKWVLHQVGSPPPQTHAP